MLTLAGIVRNSIPSCCIVTERVTKSNPNITRTLGYTQRSTEHSIVGVMHNTWKPISTPTAHLSHGKQLVIDKLRHVAPEPRVVVGSKLPLAKGQILRKPQPCRMERV
jgi:hypothetical protein